MRARPHALRALSEINQRKINIVCSLLYVELKKYAKLINEVDWWLLEGGGSRRNGKGDGVKRLKKKKKKEIVLCRRELISVLMDV